MNKVKLIIAIIIFPLVTLSQSSGGSDPGLKEEHVDSSPSLNGHPAYFGCCETSSLKNRDEINAPTASVLEKSDSSTFGGKQ